MFIPIHDRNPLQFIRFQYVTVGLIFVNVLVYLVSDAGAIAQMLVSYAIIPAERLQVGYLAYLLSHAGAFAEMQVGFALIPAELLQVGYIGGTAFGPNDVVAVPEGLTLLSYMFLHGDWLQLLGNMLFLWVFGDNVEDAMGHFRFLIFYLASGVIGGLAHVWMFSASPIPLIGASSAAAGIIAAYLLLHPRAIIWILFLKLIPLKITAAIALGGWVILQVYLVLAAGTEPHGLWAHIGGLIAGAVLVLFLRRRGVKLLDRKLKAANP